MREDFITEPTAKGICSFCHAAEAKERCVCCGGKVCRECMDEIAGEHVVDVADYQAQNDEPCGHCGR